MDKGNFTITSIPSFAAKYYQETFLLDFQVILPNYLKIWKKCFSVPFVEQCLQQVKNLHHSIVCYPSLKDTIYTTIFLYCTSLSLSSNPHHSLFSLSSLSLLTIFLSSTPPLSLLPLSLSLLSLLPSSLSSTPPLSLRPLLSLFYLPLSISLSLLSLFDPSSLFYLPISLFYLPLSISLSLLSLLDPSSLSLFYLPPSLFFFTIFTCCFISARRMMKTL